MKKLNQNQAPKSAPTNIYGIHAVEALLKCSPEKIHCLYLREHKLLNKNLNNIIALAKKHQIPVKKNHKHFEGLGKNLPTQGVIAHCTANNTASNTATELLSDILKNKKSVLLLMLDGLQDPHNLGACIRTAHAAGCDAVIIPKDRAVSLNATAKKVACGAAEFIPVITVTNLARTLAWLKQQGVWIYGLSSEASQVLYDKNFTSSTAFVMGAEGEGLRRLTRDYCDDILSIPMRGEAESLNVSVASGVCLFEALRQRTTSATSP